VGVVCGVRGLRHRSWPSLSVRGWVLPTPATTPGAPAPGSCAALEPLRCCVCRCESGCECGESIINGHTATRSSLLHLHHVYVTQQPECVMSVQVRGRVARL
jgi:hypothetical protein